MWHRCGMASVPFSGSGNAAAVRQTASKVPQITVYFWIIKILTTAMGEATADFLYFRFGAVVAGALSAVGLAVALVLQFRAREYVAWIYWSAVVMVAVFGTMAADGLHIKLGVPYSISTSCFAIALALIFAVWYLTERTLSIHSIHTPRREVFYWATVMATFALGTALGDLTANTFHLGYLKSGVLFAVVIAIPGLAYRWLGLNSVLAFWSAYVVTRPLGASFADWFGVPAALGGLDWGRGTVAIILTIPIVVLVAYLAVARPDVEDVSSRSRASQPARHRRQRQSA
jgi:uncharacterized membrane-anchored protein